MIYHSIGHSVSQEPIDLTHKQKRRPWDRVYRGARNVRCEQHVVHLQQRIVHGERLAVVHIQRRACHAALLQRLDQCRLIDQTAARGVDKVRRFFHAGKILHADHMLGIRCQPQVQRYNIALFKQGFK